MVKLTILNAWAENNLIQYTNYTLSVLQELVTQLLYPLWVSALKEYTRVQIGPDIAEAQINIIWNGRMDEVEEIFSFYLLRKQKDNVSVHYLIAYDEFL